jgi:hypothetical protein
MAKVLKVGVEMGGLSDEASVPLPDSWDEMTPEEQKEWADESLEAHVSNNVDSWWNVEDE